MANNLNIPTPGADELPKDAAIEAAFHPAPAPQPEASAPAPSGPINVVSPTGELHSIPGEQLQDAIAQGYKPAEPHQVEAHFRKEKYGDLGSQIGTALEGAASAATFGASTIFERGLGANNVPGFQDEDIRSRAEENPLSNMAGQGVGLVASAFLLPEGGAAGVLENTGNAATHALGLGAAESTVAKIGSSAVKAAVENAMVQGGNEVSKMLVAKDPNEAAQTAMADIGMAALLGGGLGAGFGATSALWKATLGAKLGGTLGAITRKLGGIEGQEANPIAQAIERSGIEVDPVMKAAITSDPEIQQMAQTLGDSSTGSGLKYQQKLKEFKSQISNKALGLLGKTPEDVAALQDLSPNQVGESIKQNLADTIKEKYEPIKRDYETISNRFKETAIPEDIKSSLAQQLGTLANNGALPDSAEMTFLQRVIKQVPKVENLEQLRKLTSALGNETSGITKQELWQIGRGVRNALNDAEENTLNKVVAEEAPELLQKHLAANAAYKDLKNTIGDLNDRIKVGDRAGVGTFLKALDGADGETILNRLNPSGKASIIEELGKNFPQVAEHVKDFHLSNIVKKAAKYGSAEEPINFNHLTKEIDKLSPEMRQFVIPKDAPEGIKTLQALTEGLPEKVGKSGTPQGVDALLSYFPGAATGAIAAMTGHGVLTGAIVGHLGKLLARDVPDATRLALLKFLGSSAQVDASGFAKAVEFIHATTRGETMLAKGTKALLKAGQEVLPQSAMPSAKDREKLDKQLKGLQTTPGGQLNRLQDVGGKTSHYLPEHGAALAQTASNAAIYLNSLRPNEDKRSPLDTKPVPNAAQKARFESALNIAQQPLIVLDKIKKGTLTANDAQDLRALYPALYNRMAQKLTNEVNEQMTKGATIPYKTRLGLSLFVGQPLDSSMTPQSIMSAQPKPTEQPQGQVKGPGEVKHTGTSLNKLPGMYQTAEQKAQVSKQG